MAYCDGMFDMDKVMRMLDDQDPRINLIPYNTNTMPRYIWNCRKYTVDQILRIASRRDNPIRRKAISVLYALDDWRQNNWLEFERGDW